MICALTVRKLKPGSFDEFVEHFRPPEGEDAPAGFKRFVLLRNSDDENEVITMGFFDGSADELRSAQSGNSGYSERLEKIAGLVESSPVSGVFDVERDITPDG